MKSLKTAAGVSLPFTALGLGAAEIGNMGCVLSDAEARETVQAAWSEGVRYFDTAPLYGLGLSELRLGEVLQDQPRESFTLSSKVGLLLDEAKAPPPRDVDIYPLAESGVSGYDYGYDAIKRSVEASLRRLGLDHIDVLYVHDIDEATHGAAFERHFRDLVEGGWRALDDLRRSGAVKAVGAGLNEWQMCERLLATVDPDIFLLAGRYTLLEQEALGSFLPECVTRGVGVVVGGPFNSGILATGARSRPIYNYDLAPDWVVEKVNAIEDTCAQHGVALPQAALQYPLRHPAVLSVIPGCVSAQQVRQNAELMRREIPPGLWADLAGKELVAAE